MNALKRWWLYNKPLFKAATTSAWGGSYWFSRIEAPFRRPDMGYNRTYDIFSIKRVVSPKYGTCTQVIIGKYLWMFAYSDKKTRNAKRVVKQQRSGENK